MLKKIIGKIIAINKIMYDENGMAAGLLTVKEADKDINKDIKCEKPSFILKMNGPAAVLLKDATSGSWAEIVYDENRQLKKLLFLPV